MQRFVMLVAKAKSLIKSCSPLLTNNPAAIPKIQIGQRQVSEYQEGGMPFGLGNGPAPSVVYATVKPQAVLKLHQNK
jgi:hypothetical protein